jgi:hypothetical protein
MKHIYFIILFQICGNTMAIFEDGQPTLACHLVKQECRGLSIPQLMMLRQTSSCTALKEFKVIE